MLERTLERGRFVAGRLLGSPRFGLYATMAASAAVPVAMLAFRVWYYDTLDLTFLVWNLELAIVPFVISQWLVLRPPSSRWAFYAGAFLWLLFFPNAPYIMTDLMHVDTRAAPLWFDVMLFLSFAWNGLIFGYLSLLDMHRLFEQRHGSVAGWLFAGFAILLGSFGIYIGRVLRWNSWDLFTEPTALLSDVAERLLHPFEHPAAYGMTLAFALFMLVGYLFLKSLIRLEQSEAVAAREAP
jgi:uncharacterized membrane protein